MSQSKIGRALVLNRDIFISLAVAMLFVAFLVGLYGIFGVGTAFSLSSYTSLNIFLHAPFPNKGNVEYISCFSKIPEGNYNISEVVKAGEKLKRGA